MPDCSLQQQQDKLESFEAFWRGSWEPLLWNPAFLPHTPGLPFCLSFSLLWGIANFLLLCLSDNNTPLPSHSPFCLVPRCRVTRFSKQKHKTVKFERPRQYFGHTYTSMLSLFIGYVKVTGCAVFYLETLSRWPLFHSPQIKVGLSQ